ncbi:hypothetical protein LPW11_10740 [Geomonas sp. RF6]|uniref:hypothetical protein n=1 Tax=Geomonas sp. RF6 TaxID=2897342 RepID=UPI001E422950|nr:hypothetical protein [Geomonas sp. RF6]UFS72650.1 hypothetical protein LPW11_10740 [Geomonas sp. RF6]
MQVSGDDHFLNGLLPPDRGEALLFGRECVFRDQEEPPFTDRPCGAIVGLREFWQETFVGDEGEFGESWEALGEGGRDPLAPGEISKKGEITRRESGSTLGNQLRQHSASTSKPFFLL